MSISGVILLTQANVHIKTRLVVSASCTGVHFGTLSQAKFIGLNVWCRLPYTAKRVNVFSNVMECTLLCSAISGVQYSQLHCFSHLIERVTIRVSVYIGILLQFKVTRRHLSLNFCQFSFTFAGNFYVQLNELNYRNVEIFRNLCTYSRRFDVISMSGYFVVILVIL